MKLWISVIDRDGLVDAVSVHLTKEAAQAAFKEATEMTEGELSKRKAGKKTQRDTFVVDVGPHNEKKQHFVGSAIRDLEVPRPITFFCTNEMCPFSSQDIVEAKKHDDARHDSDLEGEADAAISIDLTGIRL